MFDINAFSGCVIQALAAVFTLVEISTYFFLREQSLVVRVVVMCIGLVAAGPMAVYALSTVSVMVRPLLGGRHSSQFGSGAVQA